MKTEKSMIQYNLMKFLPPLILLAFVIPAHAYTVVQISPAATPSLEQDFISKTTNQFQADYFKNPLASNTYHLTLFGENPNFNPRLTDSQVAVYLTTVDSFTFVYGWASGMVYERNHDIALLQGAAVNCSTNTICSQAFTGAIDSIYTQSFSTPTVVPGF